VKFLVDANVLNEMTRPSPDTAVLEWMKLNSSKIAVDPVILGELRYGILLLPKGKKRSALEAWFAAGAHNLVCLPWDLETGLRWAELLANLKRRGTPMPVKDSMIAATAIAHGLTVVTRNTIDFAKAKVPTLNPFS
jgi:toxin FitB